jgi:hypothetical protein
MKNLLSVSLVFLLGAVCMFGQHRGHSSKNVDVSGKWELTIDTPHGTIEFALQLKQDGSKLSGTVEREGKSHTVTGRIEGSKVSFNFEAMPNVNLDFTGTVEDGKMSGKAGEHDLPWKAARLH